MKCSFSAMQITEIGKFPVLAYSNLVWVKIYSSHTVHFLIAAFFIIIDYNMLYNSTLKENAAKS